VITKGQVGVVEAGGSAPAPCSAFVLIIFSRHLMALKVNVVCVRSLFVYCVV